jgi:chromosome segregation ATPase
MTDTWENEGGSMDGLDALLTNAFEKGYNASKENARHEKQDLEATIDGLGAQNTHLEQENDILAREKNELLDLMKGRNQRVATLRLQFQEVSVALGNLSDAVRTAIESLTLLSDVPLKDLDDSIDSIRSELDQALTTMGDE